MRRGSIRKWTSFGAASLRFIGISILMIPALFWTGLVLAAVSYKNAFDEAMSSWRRRCREIESRYRGFDSDAERPTLCTGLASSNGIETQVEMRRGGKLEALIRKAAWALEVAQTAKLHQWPVPTILQDQVERCEGCSKRFRTSRLIYTSRTGSDFFGWTANGRIILVEAKESMKPTLPIGSSSGHGLKKHQLLELYDCHRAGGLALIAWKRSQEVAVFDLDVWERIGKEKSIAWSKIPDSLKHRAHEDDAATLFEPYLHTPMGSRT